MRVFVLLCGTTTAAAQAQTQEPVMETVSWFYNDAKQNFLEAAEAMPVEHYGFRPTAGVRNFGEIVGHIANWQFTNCSAAKGEVNPNRTDFEKSTTKAMLLAGIRAAYAYCDEILKTMNLEKLSVRSRGSSVMFRAMSALAHPYLHYGNMITYMRLKGIVPPSTVRRGGG